MGKKQYYVYILKSFSGVFYIGVTDDIVRRVWEHKSKVVVGFTKKYNVDKLIFYEIYQDPETAILREKQLKNWNRRKKILLITKTNPKFEEIPLADLY